MGGKNHVSDQPRLVDIVIDQGFRRLDLMLRIEPMHIAGVNWS